MARVDEVNLSFCKPKVQMSGLLTGDQKDSCRTVTAIMGKTLRKLAQPW